MGAFSIWHWLVVLAIVVVVFGTKKLRNMGGDLGSAIKGFKEGIKESETESASPPPSHVSDQTTQKSEVKPIQKETIETATVDTAETVTSQPPSDEKNQTVNIETEENKSPKL